jgi:hypothetical protein
MANSLNRDLHEGDKVVMQGNPASFEVAVEMFGAKASTAGRKLGIKYVGAHDDGIFCVDATEIDAEKTMERHGKENGWE